MSKQNYNVFSGVAVQGVPIKAWTKGVPVEEEAQRQLERISQLPVVWPHVAVMPDVHLGKGATVGSVIPTDRAIIPAAVGVDLGCGMQAARLNLKAHQLPDSLAGMRSAIEAAVPHGRSNNGGKGDRGAWADPPDDVTLAWSNMHHAYEVMCEMHPKMSAYNTIEHLGTLGTGNHFVEVCLDTEDNVWLMLHSGSRGVGNRIGSYFIELAKQDMLAAHGRLPEDHDLAYLDEGTKHFGDYVRAVSWAQDYARVNRELMFAAALRAVNESLGRFYIMYSKDQAVNCHHNYVSREHHFGKDLWVTRKGAVSARKDELGIIPGSMGAKSFIVRGLGHPESFHSCSHGAGRKMSRNAAKKAFSLQDHIEATKGIECRKDEDVIDETPMAYKDIDDVMAAQSDLVEVVATLRQVLCVKG